MSGEHGPPPTLPTDTPDRITNPRAYFRAHRDHYTAAALQQAATDAGYSAVEIEAAWIAATAAAHDTPPRPQTNVLVVIVVAALYMVAVYLVAVVWLSGVSGNAAVIVYLGAGVGGAIGWALLRDDRPSVATGLGCGVLLIVVLPVVAFLVILGICVAIGFSMTGN